MGQGLATPPDASNRLIKDRYYLQKVKLGSGSFGTVWRAKDKRNGEVVAVKQIDKVDKLGAPKRGIDRNALEREINLIRCVPHENITKLIDTFEDEKSIFVILEYCDGGDFGDKVNERGMEIEEPEVAHWVRQMCSAIATMHSKGICHRDIKPDNFMVSGSSGLKLCDFGLAIAIPRGKMLMDKMGTPAFMAPELHHLPNRSPGYSFPVDMWAAGVSMYMVIFGGRHPFLDHGQLNEGWMLSGSMDFTESRSTILGFDIPGGSIPRFSDAARGLCTHMVDPNPVRRLSAVAALGSSWLSSARPATSVPSTAPSRSPTRADPAAAPAPVAPAAGMGRPSEGSKHGAGSCQPKVPRVPSSEGQPKAPRADSGRLSPSSDDARVCRMGCGYKSAIGTTRYGNPFDTCCKGCALGQGHDAHCAQVPAVAHRKKILPGS